MIYSIVEMLNRVGAGFVGFSLAMLVQSSLLILALFIIDFAIRRRVRAVFRYCIWMLLFVKLVLPPSLCFPTGIGYWCHPDILKSGQKEVVEESGDISTRPGLEPAISTSSLPPASVSENIGPAGRALPKPVPQKTKAEVKPALSESPDISVSWQAVMFIIWLAGAAAFAVLLLQRLWFVREVIAQSEPANERLSEVLQDCRMRLGLRRDVKLRLSKNMLSPAACGLFRPVVLMPKSLLENLSRDELRAVLIHELAHIKRGDLWVNLVQTLLQVVYFYNPLVWLANSRVRNVREKAVDEMVLTRLGGQAKQYSNTLIDIAEIAFSRPHFSLRLIGVVESKKALTSRIKHIVSRPFPKSAKLGFLGLLIIFAIGAIALPMASNRVSKKNQELLQILQEDSNQERGRAAEELMDKVRSGKISSALTEKALKAITSRIKKHPKTRNRRFDSYPNVFWEELKLAWLAIENDIVDNTTTVKFIKALETVQCTYEERGQWHLNGDLAIPREDILAAHQLQVATIDNREIHNVLPKIFVRSVVGRLTWGSEVETSSQPEKQARVKLNTTWYQIPTSLIEKLSSVSKPEQAPQISRMLEKASTKKICEYSRELKLSKKSGWKGIFSDDSFNETQAYKPSNFKATLSNGVTVELIGVCEHPSDGKQWWQPDGNLMELAPYDRITGELNCSEERKAYELAVKFTEVAEETFARIQTEPGGSSIGGSIFSTVYKNDKRVKNLGYLGICLPDSLDTCVVKVLVASVEWRNLVESSGTLSGSSSYGTEYGGLSFSKVFERAGQISVIVSHSVTGEFEKRFVAVDKHGQVHKSKATDTAGSGDFEQMTVSFEMNKDDIAKFIFQIRPYETITFKNVSLKPGYKTDVKIEVEKSVVPVAGEKVGVHQPEYRKVYITEQFGLLDLSTGDFIPRPDDLNVSYKEYFKRLGKGDIGFDDGVICTLSGGKVQLLDNGTIYPLAYNPADHDCYILPHNPCSVLITTADGDKYEAEINFTRDAIIVEYAKRKEPITSGLSFGPVIERLVYEHRDESTGCLIDFDTGKVVNAPEFDSDSKALEWMREKGLDAINEEREGVPALCGVDMAVLPFDIRFEDVSPEKVFQDLKLSKVQTPSTMSARGELPRSYLFKTREGGMGIVKILKITKRKRVHFNTKLEDDVDESLARLKELLVGLSDAVRKNDFETILSLTEQLYKKTGELDSRINRAFSEHSIRGKRHNLLHKMIKHRVEGASHVIEKLRAMLKRKDIPQVKSSVKKLNQIYNPLKNNIEEASKGPAALKIRYKMLQPVNIQEPAAQVKGEKPTAEKFASRQKRYQTASFGVAEVDLEDIDESPEAALIDFDTSEVVKIPDSLREDWSELFRGWLAGKGLDAGVEFGGGKYGVLVFDAVATRIEPERWDKITAAEVREALADEPKGVQFDKHENMTMMVVKGKHPQTFAFKTREGGIGVLQVIDVDHKNKAIKFRYKMLKGKSVVQTEDVKSSILGMWYYQSNDNQEHIRWAQFGPDGSVIFHTDRLALVGLYQIKPDRTFEINFQGTDDLPKFFGKLLDDSTMVISEKEQGGEAYIFDRAKTDIKTAAPAPGTVLSKEKSEKDKIRLVISQLCQAVKAGDANTVQQLFKKDYLMRIMGRGKDTKNILEELQQWIQNAWFDGGVNVCEIERIAVYKDQNDALARTAVNERDYIWNYYLIKEGQNWKINGIEDFSAKRTASDLISDWRKIHDRARMDSEMRLRRLGHAIDNYTHKHDGRLAETIEQLREFMPDKHFDWFLENVVYLKKVKTVGDKAHRPIAYDKSMLKKRGQTNVLFLNGEVKYIKAQELQSLGIAPAPGKTQGTGPNEAPPVSVYLPDLETPDAEVVLDLATGSMLSAKQMEKDRLYFEKIGRGDIAYDYAGNKGAILFLRDAEVGLIEGDTVIKSKPDIIQKDEGFIAYFVDETPKVFMVTTEEGLQYKTTISHIMKKGCMLEYSFMNQIPPEQVEGQDVWSKAVNGVRAKLRSKRPYILYEDRSDMLVEVENQSGQEIQIEYPPKYFKEDRGKWRDLGRIEILDMNDKPIQPTWTAPLKRSFHTLEPYSKYERIAELGIYEFDFHEPGKYKVRVTFKVQPLESGEAFDVSTNWLEFEAVLTEHVPGTPYTAEEALKEAMAFDTILLRHNKISKAEAVDKFLYVAGNYPDSPYELKSYFWASVILSQRPVYPDKAPTDEQMQQAESLWNQIIAKWPELVLPETVFARHNLAATDNSQFEKLLDFCEWLTTRTREQKITSITKWEEYFSKAEKTVAEKLKYLNQCLASRLDTLERNLTMSKNVEQLQIIIELFPNSHLAELAQKELQKKKK